MSLQDVSAQSKRPEPGLFARIATQVVERLEADEVLAYGGWPHGFIQAFRPQRRFALQAFRPQIEGKNAMAVPADVVISVDYLNEVGMLQIKNTLDDLQRVTVKAGFFYVSVPEFADDIVTAKTIHRPINWWLSEFMVRFDVHTFQRTPGGFYVIVYPMVKEVIH